MTKATRRATKTDTLIQNARGELNIRGLNRHRIIPRVIQPPSGGANAPPSGQGFGTTGNFLEPQGDTMIGPIAFFPKDATQDITDPDNPSIDIGKDGVDYSTYIITGQESNKLGTILNAGFDGQLLYLQSIAASPLELINGDAINLGNILTGTGANIFVDFGNFATLIFDQRSTTGAPSIQGAWRVVQGGTGTPGGATQLNDLTDVTLTSPALDDVLTFDGALWVNLPSTSGGLATDLSNMISPTLPTVDLSLNGNSLLGVLNVDFDGFGGILGLSNLSWRQTGQIITSLSEGLFYDVDSLQSHEFDVGGVRGMRVADIGGGVLAMELFNNSIDDVKDINFDGNAVIPNTIAGIGLNTTDTSVPFMEYNVGATNQQHVFSIAGNSRLNIDLNGISIVGTTETDILQLALGGSVSFISGRMRNDGTDVFIFSGGEERNITNVVAGDFNKISQGNTSITILDTGSGSITDIIDGAIVSTKDVNNFAISQNVSFGANSLSGLGNTTPGGTSNFDLGGATLFWRNVFTDRITFENLGTFGNFIEADSPFGIDYEVDANDNHDFKVAGSTIFRIEALEVNMLANLDMNNQDIINVDQFNMQGIGSNILMNGGSIQMVGGSIDMNLGSITNLNDIIGIDDLIFNASSSSRIDMRGGDILGVDDLTVNDNLTVGNSGSLLGFFGIGPNIRPTMSRAQSSDSLAVLIVRFQILQDILSQLQGDFGNPDGLGLIQLA